MFKKICILLVFFLASCQTPTVKPKKIFFKPASPIEESELITKESFRVGVLLPLSGDAANVGNSLKNAAMLALEDINNPNLILQFYDTKSSPEGAREAAENAINQDVKLIIGPLMAAEVEAVSAETRRHDVPVVAFSTNESVLQNQVYTLGLLIGEQIERIVNYASSQGRQQFALLLPDNSTGIAVAKEAIKAVKRNGGRVVKVAFYEPNTNDFSSIVKKLTNYENRASSAEGIGFDAVIIPESGSRLKSATAMFGYYDVFAPEVLFMGTSVWENTNLSKETTLQKAVYPALSRSYSAYFNKKYRTLFGVYPSGLAAFGYDAVALASSLSKKGNTDLNAAITNPSGFSGINGAFRIFANGKNQHSLDVMQITAKGDAVADAAAHSFVDSMALDDGYVSFSYDDMPMIFGKDAAQFRNQVFGDF